ncbi:MAG: hypothetical protein SV377_02665 [Halobacteria archaeon]|nr:hypothetical protein [Halobacteria archaeon]
MKGNSPDAGKDPDIDDTADGYVAERDRIADNLSTLLDPRTFLRRQQIGLLSLLLLAIIPLGTGIVVREIWVTPSSLVSEGIHRVC